jgi:hypothetical protein
MPRASQPVRQFRRATAGRRACGCYHASSLRSRRSRASSPMFGRALPSDLIGQAHHESHTEFTPIDKGMLTNLVTMERPGLDWTVVVAVRFPTRPRRVAIPVFMLGCYGSVRRRGSREENV